MTQPARVGPIVRVIGAVGAQIIYLLIRVLGRDTRLEDVPWLQGPDGGEYIGDHPYEELAQREGLTVVRDAEGVGLLPDFDVLSGPSFEAGAVDEQVRRFYERTSDFEIDLWARVYFPLSIGLWLLVKTISRTVNQLNFPIEALEAARGTTSEIVLLRDGEGATRHTGWLRCVAASNQVIYSGFYSAGSTPGHNSPLVKAVFPMPGGNATVFLRPTINAHGEFELVSDGRRFGEAGFYRVHTTGPGRARIWRVRSLVERIRLYVDEKQQLRCDHTVHFWGLPVLKLHYQIRPLVDADGEVQS